MHCLYTRFIGSAVFTLRRLLKGGVLGFQQYTSFALWQGHDPNAFDFV